MKTPEQIAREFMKFHRGRPDSQIVANIPSMIAAAIEADRAQRERADKIAADRAEEAAISVNAVLMAEQDGLITLSDHDKTLLTRAREHMNVITADLRDEDDA